MATQKTQTLSSLLTELLVKICHTYRRVIRLRCDMSLEDFNVLAKSRFYGTSSLGVPFLWNEFTWRDYEPCHVCCVNNTLKAPMRKNSCANHCEVKLIINQSIIKASGEHMRHQQRYWR